MRPSNRTPDQLRTFVFEPGFAKYAEGSCLVKCGDTHVLCTASIDEKVPSFLRGTGLGWGGAGAAAGGFAGAAAGGFGGAVPGFSGSAAWASSTHH